MKDSQIRLCTAVLLAWCFLAGAAPGKAATDASRGLPQPAVGDPRIGANMDWSPLAPGKKIQFLPKVDEALDELKGGRAESFEKIIRLAYDLISKYARNEGHDLSFELDDFRTIHAPEALSLKFGDVVSLDIPKRISIQGKTVEHRKNDRIDSVTRSYKASWEPARPIPDLGAWKNRRLQEFIEIGRAELPALAYLRAVTSYRVTVSLAGSSREYQAAFLWLAGAGGSAIDTFSAQDPVTDRVTLVFAEEVSPEAQGERPETRNPSNITEALAFGSCFATTRSPLTNLYHITGGTGHIVDGTRHHYYSRISLTCRCESTCDSYCQPALATQGCYDDGGSLGFHVPATDLKLSPGIRLDTYDGAPGASCGGAYACAMTQCITPYCAFSISVTLSGGITASPPGSAFWSVTVPESVTCGGCTLREPIGPERPPKENCPVLISLNGKKPELTDLAGGAQFDLDRDGVAERLSWTAGGSSSPFLALDSNLNGRIDDGGELFGNYTPQSLDIEKPHGYAAMAEYDKPAHGGNGDGVLDTGDQIFASLLLWFDNNHDGTSQAGELVPVSQWISAIELDYKESRSRDRYGNEFRYRGTVWLNDGRKSRSVDVFLLSQ